MIPLLIRLLIFVLVLYLLYLVYERWGRNKVLTHGPETRERRSLSNKDKNEWEKIRRELEGEE